MVGSPPHRPPHRPPHYRLLLPHHNPSTAPHQALDHVGLATSTTAAWLAEEARRPASRPGSPLGLEICVAAAAATMSPSFVAEAGGLSHQPQAREKELAAAGSAGEGLLGDLRQALSTAPHALSQGRYVQVEPLWSEDDNGDRVAYALVMEQPPPAVTHLDLTTQSNEGARSPRVSKARHMAAAYMPRLQLCVKTQSLAICSNMHPGAPGCAEARRRGADRGACGSAQHGGGAAAAALQAVARGGGGT